MLYILRHGQSLWNAENRFTGWKDIDLSDKGVQEATYVADIIKNSGIQVEHIFTSDLTRAKETGQIIKTNLQLCVPFESTSLLNERNYGDFSGMNKNEVKLEKGEDFVHTLRRSYTYKPENGESLKDVVKRVSAFMERDIPDNSLIVAHGNTLRALFVHLGIKFPDNIEFFEVPTCQLIAIDLKSKQFGNVNPYKFRGRQILDSRGNPTVEVICTDAKNKIIGRGSTPSGASCGSKEACELRDGISHIFQGKSVQKALENVQIINDKLCIRSLRENNIFTLDKQLITIDGTDNKTYLGGNTTTAYSFCFLEALSNYYDLEKFKYIQGVANNKKPLFIPTPFANVLNGGKHGSGGLQIQEFMIFVNETYDINKQIQILYDVFYHLKICLKEQYGKQSTNFGDEGGYVPCGMKTNAEALDILKKSIENASLTPNKDVFIALDCAASEFYNKDSRLYEIEKNTFLNGKELIQYYQNMIAKYPFIKSIEDPFDEDDYDCWIEFSEKCEEIMVVGDDLYCTNKRLVEKGLNDKWANSLLLKVNQIGTVSEAIESAQLMLEKGNKVIVSHRSGETNHSYIIDVAVGIGAQYVKIGGLCRGERIEKYNRLLEIYDLIEST